MKKKITFLTMQLRKFGGIERFVTTLANIFSDEYDVEIVANYGKNNERPAFALNDSVKVSYLLPDLPDEVSMKSILKSFQFHKIPAELRRRIKINNNRCRAYKEFLSSLDTDIIITERALYSSLVQKYYTGKAKLIATDHNYHQNQTKYINELLKSVKGFDYLVVASHELQEFYKDKLAKAKCIYIPNPLAKIPQQKSNLTSKNIVASGRFYPEKDFLALIEVMNLVHAKDPDVKLFLIGDGPEKDKIKAKITEYGLNDVVVLTGALRPEEMEKYYYNSSLFVMTSITEAFGLVITEAMSYGLPVIAFDRASGAREQINDRNGILIPNADTKLMANRITEALSNNMRLQKYQREVIKSASLFKKDTIYKQWVKILN